MNIPGAGHTLDIFSVKAMALITVLSVSLMTLSAWRVNARVPGMRLFTAGLLSLSFGAVAGMARILIAGNIIFIVCNAFMVGGMALIAQSVRAFRRMPALQRPWLAGLAVLVVSLYCWWLFANDNFGMRVGVISAAMSLLSFDAAVSLFRRVASADRVIHWPTGFAFAFTGCYLAIRAASALFGLYGATLWAPVPVELASTICANIAYIGCAFGMMLAANTRLRHETEQLAFTDPLTSLPNRRSFGQCLVAAETRALATNGKFGLIYLDIDHFKWINDTQGHAAGDDFLRRISRVMSRRLGPDDCLGRIGGDEFAVLLGGAGSHDEIAVIAAGLKSIVELEPVVAGLGLSVSVSCGIAMFPEDGTSALAVMNEADLAMYQARQLSRASLSNSTGRNPLVAV